MMFLPGQFRGVQSLWIIGVVLALLTVIGAGAAVWDLYRRTIEEASAREAAIGALRSELNDTLTTLLLHCELALETSDLSLTAAGRLDSVHKMAQKLRTQLEAGEALQETR